MIYPLNFEAKISFDLIRDKIKDYCLFELGRKKVEEMSFSARIDEIQMNLSLTSEFRLICQFEDSFPVSHYIDITESLKKVSVEGSYLTEEEIFSFQLSLDAIKSIIRFFKNAEEIKYPNLKKLTGNIPFYSYIEDRISSILSKHGKIKDNASPELQKIRKDIQQHAVAVSRKLQHILKQAIDDGYVEKDSSLSVRNGRQVIPVQVTHKRRLGGIIHDESATGRTAYIEPTEVVELNNIIRELEYAEDREIIRILVHFTSDIRPYLEDLLRSYDFLGTIDFIRAKALFALSVNAVQPVVKEEPGFSWQQAVHPLLYLHHKVENKEVVPLDIKLDNKNRIVLISGPNAGGKSVCLKTVGLLQYMLQCGMLVPMIENSEAGLFKDIFIDIGDEQSIENDLSTYSSHLLSMKYFLRNAGPETLLLIDEFGTGTEPQIGGAIAEALLYAMNRKGLYGVITTHYTNLKHFASATDGIINGAMLFDTGQMQPLFRLEIGKPGSSFAIDIARKIGLPEDILKNAADKVGEDHINFDRHLREIIRDKRYWESKRNQIRIAEKELSGVVSRYSEELEQVQKLKKEILDKAIQQAEEMLSKTNREIENTIRIIKESQAEKEKTKEARKKLEGVKNKILSMHDHEDSMLTAKLHQLKEQRERIRNENREKPEPKKKVKTIGDEYRISVGDAVKIFGQDAIGEVLDVHGNTLLVAFGNMITTLKASRLEKVSEADPRDSLLSGRARQGYATHVMERKLNFKAEIDVRGKRGEEAIDLVRNFVDEALVVGARELKILHGKGNGILKQVIREYLRTVDIVKSCHDEHVEHGGAGITVVLLDY
ncbi:MAG: Smr/MutS family protein [Bacteroidales bacterium]|nr:Smr/MutS family protein [Bacteroidales bacterium]